MPPHPRTTTNPAIHHGTPVITGTRVAVATIVTSLADGDTPETLLANYPQLTREDIAAAQSYTRARGADADIP